ncbi:MAG: sugar phosphate isomerase/epimerase [Chloroflexota bacterium]|nr:MAG: sugar phosphate isomerase/epimerase [Chloroflexota bacterium]
MKFGVNLMAWSGAPGPAEWSILPELARLGYDGVEIPIFDLATFDVAAARNALAISGLAPTVSSAIPFGASLTRWEQVDAGVTFLDGLIDLAARLGAYVVCGPLYAPVGEMTGTPPSDREWDTLVDGLRRVAPRAQAAGVCLAIEPLNRFETHILNTAARGAELVDAVGSSAMGLLLDTFHTHIEEKSVGAAIATAGARVRHFHISENDRGVVGSGQVRWDEVAAALKMVGYDGWLVAETFNGRIADLAAATAIWRPLVESPLAYARDSLAFARRVFG